jgi:hypothetical protein
MERKMWRRSAAILAFLAIVMPEARADPVADFYKGKLIRVVVGFAGYMFNMALSRRTMDAAGPAI